jgi:hypothetical protein
MNSLSNLNYLQTRIVNLLKQGIPANRVAAILDCEPSYISQLVNGNNLIEEEVQGARGAKIEADLERDTKLNSIEDKLIDKVDKLVDSPWTFTNPMEAVRALKEINSMKRKAEGNLHGDDNSSMNLVVNLTLPKTILNNFLAFDTNNQITKIGDTSLVTIDTANLNTIALKPKEINKQLEQKMEESWTPVKHQRIKNQITLESIL